jgi:hypothetical protein
MASEDKVARQHLLRGEEIVVIQRGAVSVGAIDRRTDSVHPMFQAGTSKGWVGVTNERRVIYGSFGRFGSAKFEGAFRFTSWSSDPRGVAFENTGMGPEDICVFIPMTIAPQALHEILGRSSGGDGEIRKLQELYANRVSFGAQVPTEYAEINRVYGLLRDRGKDADQALVDKEKAANAEWMQTNPWLSYHEPHLDRDWFDAERPDRQ